MNLYSEVFSIGELARRTGVGVSTLRAWERRHGFPEPQRLVGGHRRYSEADAVAIRDALRDRRAGLPLPDALAAARERVASPRLSVAAALQRALPDVARVVVTRRTLVAVSHAIEDEAATRADRPILIGTFQRPKFYARSAPRWHDLARTSTVTIAIAASEQSRRRAALWELPVPLGSPIEREWSVICDAPGFTACLVAVELPAARGPRRFEAVWTAEPAAVREAARAACVAAVAAAPALGDHVRRLAEPVRVTRQASRATTGLANRMLGYVDAAVRA